jgi:hypothetical protein
MEVKNVNERRKKEIKRRKIKQDDVINSDLFRF